MKILSILLLGICSLVSAEDLFSLYGKSQEAAKKKDYAGMLAITEQMIEKAPGHSGIRFHYARALAANNRNEESLKVLKSVARMGGAPSAAKDEYFIKFKDSAEFQEIVSTFEKNRQVQGRSDVAFTLSEKDFIPEGIAYDPVEKNFYVGSTYRRKIVAINAAGEVRDFVKEKQDGVWGMVGMEVDPVRRHLWVNTANGGAAANMFMIDPDPATEGKTAILRIDLKTGNILKRYDLGSKESPRFLNDVAIAPNGDVYVSESMAGEIYRITTKADTLELLIPTGSMGYCNGLALSQDARFLYVSHIEGITVMDLQSGQKQLLAGPPDSELGNHDGMIFYKNSLIGIQGLTGDVDRIVRFHLEDPTRVGRIEVLQNNHPLFQLPTTGDMKGDEFYYIANSQLRSFDEKGKIFPPEKLNNPLIFKVDLLESEKEELRAVHEKEMEAHRKANVNQLLEHSPDEFITVNSGKVARVKKEDERKMFESYFQGAQYSEYSDLESPIISVSPDGRFGWVITRLRAKRTQEGKTQEFVYAGIMTYEKRGENWIRVANVSTFES